MRAAAVLTSLVALVGAQPTGSKFRSQRQRDVETLRPPSAFSDPTTGVVAQPNLASIVSVLDFGAVGDGATDNTASFQAALNSLATSATPGGIVFVPAGRYVFDGSLDFPPFTSMVGTFQAVPAHPVGQNGPPPTDGSVLMPRANQGNESAPAFITLNADCTLKGFVVYYPDQVPTAAPVPYPYSIAMKGSNPAVMDVELLNAWNGIQAVQAPRHYIARVQGQPINVGQCTWCAVGTALANEYMLMSV